MVRVQLPETCRDIDMTSLLRRWLADEEGNDLVEYALLSSVVAIASFAAVTAIGVAINSTYTGLDAAAQALWEPQPPTN